MIVKCIEKESNNLIINNISKMFTPDTNNFGKFYVFYNVTIIIEDGKIFRVLTDNKEFEINAMILEKYKILDAKGLAILPGFVDSHTHPVFAATRENEFEMRNTGKSYEEIASSGGGIRNSVRKLRKLSEDELYKRSKKIIDKFLTYGTTTIEAKSGYGLTVKDEIKMLRVIKKLNDNSKLDITPTFLGAHEIPDEYRDNREGYIELIIGEMIPKIAEENLATACDIFIEKNVYTVEEGRRILTTAKRYGLDVKIHADQLSHSGASELASELGAISADHLEFISDKAIENMIEKNVVFNLLPGAAYFIRMKEYPPARKIIELGGIVSLATDFNPGSCYSLSLPMIMNIASVKMGMTAEESVWAATIGGAMALKLEETVGSIELGKKADLILMDIDNLKEIPYNMGMNLVEIVIKDGEIV